MRQKTFFGAVTNFVYFTYKFLCPRPDVMLTDLVQKVSPSISLITVCERSKSHKSIFNCLLLKGINSTTRADP